MKKPRPKRFEYKIKKYRASKKFKRVFVVINPASGKNEPILNVINSVFGKHGIEWEVGVTKKFGDAKVMARKAIKQDFDLIAGYGGDGTQHEIVNSVVGTKMPIAILPGGTGNGFAAGLGLPDTLKEALEVICTSNSIAKVDLVKAGNKYFVSRMYTGIEPDEQTDREMKDKYGVVAYGISGLKRSKKKTRPVKYHLTIDGKRIEEEGIKLYVVNSGSTGMHVSIGDFNPTDGVLDIFIIGHELKSKIAATERFLKFNSKTAGFKYWKGKKIKILTSPDQPVWADGEYIGRTPKDINILPKALTVVVLD
jgi:diacylglycerol kinase (ATP)